MTTEGAEVDWMAEQWKSAQEKRAKLLPGIIERGLRAVNWEELERRAVELVPRIAHELASAPVYIVAAAKITGVEKMPETCAACTQATAGLILRPYVQEWRGPGVGIIYSKTAIVVNAWGWLPFCPTDRRGDQAGFIADVFDGIFLHELAHALHRDYAAKAIDIQGPCYTETMRWEDRVELARHLQRHRTPEDDEDQALSVADYHSLEWLRVALHLRWRFIKATDRYIHPILTAQTTHYGLSGASEYDAILELHREYEAFAGMTLKEIASWPLPKDLADLWRADLLKRDGISTKQPESTNMKIFEKVRGLFQARQMKAADDFHDLARRVANGQADAEEAARVLEATQRTPENLEAEVARLQKRRELQKLVQQADGIEREREAIAAKLNAADVERQAAEDRYTATILPLHERQRQLDAVEQRANAARAQLEQTAPQHLKDKALAITAEIGKYSARKRQLAQQLDDATYAARQSAIRLETAGPESDFLLVNSGKGRPAAQADFDGLRAAAKAASERLEAIQAEFEEIRVAEAELEKQLAAVRSEMLRP